MTRQHTVIRNAHDWLVACSNTHGVRIDDQRLISQVKLWEVLHDVIDQMGTDVHQPLDKTSLALASLFSSQLTRWLDESQLRLSWCLSTDPSQHSKAHMEELKLSHGFALLFLESSAFRAPPDQVAEFLSVTAHTPGSLSAGSPANAALDVEGAMNQKKQMAERALEKARQVLVAVGRAFSDTSSQTSQGDEEHQDQNGICITQSFLRHAPSYAFSMIISAIVFLVRVHENFGNTPPSSHSTPSIDAGPWSQAIRSDFEKIKATLSTLQTIAQLNSEHHLVVKMAEGTKELLVQLQNRCEAFLGGSNTLAGGLPLSTDMSTGVSFDMPPREGPSSTRGVRNDMRPHTSFAASSNASSLSHMIHPTHNLDRTIQTAPPRPYDLSGSVAPAVPCHSQGLPLASLSSNGQSVNSGQNRGGGGAGAGGGTLGDDGFAMDQFDMLSDLRPISGLDFWQEFFTDM